MNDTLRDGHGQPQPARGRHPLHAQLDAIEDDFRQGRAISEHRERHERNIARAGRGAAYRRLAADVLQPVRFERDVPLSRLSTAMLPDPEQLNGPDWLKELFECSTAAASLSQRTEHALQLFQAAGDGLLLVAAMTGEKPRNTAYFKNAYLPAYGAISTGGVGTGKEWIPTSLSGRLLERIGVDAALVELFEVQPMSTNPFTLPAFAVTPGRLKQYPEQTTDTGQAAASYVTPATRSVLLSVNAPIGATVLSSSELIEDSAVLLIPAIEQELGDWLAAGVDDALVNGDTAVTHMDADVTASDDPRKVWDGLRKLAPGGQKTDASDGALTAAMLRANRKKLGRAGTVARQLVHLVSAAGLAQLAGDSAFISLERYGPLVTPLPGEQGRIDGIPVVVSDYVRADLNAAGVYDGSTTNRSVALTLNMRGFVIGQRRGLAVSTIEAPFDDFDQRAVKASLRLAFTTTQTTVPVALAYNLAAT